MQEESRWIYYCTRPWMNGNGSTYGVESGKKNPTEESTRNHPPLPSTASFPLGAPLLDQKSRLGGWLRIPFIAECRARYGREVGRRYLMLPASFLLQPQPRNRNLKHQRHREVFTRSVRPSNLRPGFWKGIRRVYYLLLVTVPSTVLLD